MFFQPGAQRETGILRTINEVARHGHQGSTVVVMCSRRLVRATISNHSRIVVPAEVDHRRACTILTISVGGQVNVRCH